MTPPLPKTPTPDPEAAVDAALGSTAEMRAGEETVCGGASW